MLKKIIIAIFSSFLFYQFCNVIYILTGSNFKLNGYVSFFVGWILSLIAVGIFGIMGIVYKTNQLLPSAYYHIKNKSLITTIYKLIGLRYFRAALLFFFWGKQKNRKRFFNGTKRGIQNFLFQSRQAEFGHLAALVLTLIGSLILLYKGYLLLSVFMTLFNIIGNLYPILLQRYHRVRIQHLTQE